MAEHWNLLTDLTLDHLDHLDHGRGYAVRGSFLRDLDAAMSGSVRRDCIGGFVVTQLYGLSRAMVDVDVIEPPAECPTQTPKSISKTLSQTI